MFVNLIRFLSEFCTNIEYSKHKKCIFCYKVSMKKPLYPSKKIFRYSYSLRINVSDNFCTNCNALLKKGNNYVKVVAKNA